MADVVWKIRAAPGHGDGWLREWWAGPIITGDELGAQQFDSLAEAVGMLQSVNARTSYPMVVVAVAAGPRVIHGPASAATPARPSAACCTAVILSQLCPNWTSVRPAPSRVRPVR